MNWSRPRITAYCDPDPDEAFTEDSFELAKYIEATNGVIVPSGSSYSITPEHVVAVANHVRKYAPRVNIVASHLDPKQILHHSLIRVLDGIELVYFHNGPPELDGQIQSDLYPKLVTLWGANKVRKSSVIVTSPNLTCYKLYGGRTIKEKEILNHFNYHLARSDYDSYTLSTGDLHDDVPIELIKNAVSVFNKYNSIEKLTVFAGINSLEKAKQVKSAGVLNIGIDNIIQEDPNTAKEIVTHISGLVHVKTECR